MLSSNEDVNDISDLFSELSKKNPNNAITSNLNHTVNLRDFK